MGCYKGHKKFSIEKQKIVLYNIVWCKSMNKKLKILLVLILIPIFCLCGCQRSNQNNNGDSGADVNQTDGNTDNTVGSEHPSGEKYVDIELLYENLNPVVDGVLEVGKNYYLLVLLLPGSNYTTYSDSRVEHNDQEVFIREDSESYSGEFYLMRGLKECETEVTAKIIVNHTTQETIERELRLKFVAPAE